MSAKGSLVGSICAAKLDARAKTARLPMIDLSGLSQQVRTRSLVVEDIGKACRKLGCFKVG